jgi:hypothetical protein
MLLNERHGRFQQVGKEEREQQNEKGAARDVEDGRREQKKRYGRNYIPRTIIE